MNFEPVQGFEPNSFYYAVQCLNQLSMSYLLRKKKIPFTYNNGKDKIMLQVLIRQRNYGFTEIKFRFKGFLRFIFKQISYSAACSGFNQVHKTTTTKFKHPTTSYYNPYSHSLVFHRKNKSWSNPRSN